MARHRQSEDDRIGRRPATTPEHRELELSAAAYDLAEKQIRDGTASSQVITHFLKAGSMRERLEQLRMEKDIELMEVKKESMERQDRMDELFTAAIDAMKTYSGQGEVQEGMGPDPYED